MITNNRAPLNDSQLGVYLDCMAKPDATCYNIVFEYIFDKEKTDKDKLCRSVEAVLSHYAAFNSVLEEEDGEIYLVYRPEKRRKTTVNSISEAEYKKISENPYKPFDLNGGCLCFSDIYETENRLYLITQMHHAVFDGTSVHLFKTAFRSAYNDEPLPTENTDVFDENLREKEIKDKNGFDSALEYYENYIGGIEVDCNLIPDKANDRSVKNGNFKMMSSLSENELKAFAAEHSVSENIVFLSAFSYAIAKYTAQNEAMFISVNDGRRGKGLENTMGMFVHTFPLYFKFDEKTEISKYMSYVKQTYKTTMQNEAPFVKLCEKMNLNSDVNFVYQSRLIDTVDIGEGFICDNLIDIDEAMSNLGIMVFCSDEGYCISADYREAIYTNDCIRNFVEFYENVLRGFISCERLCDITLCSSAQKERIAKINSTGYAYDRTLSCSDYFLKEAKLHPDSLALSFMGKEYTYSEFEEITASIAYYIDGKGIGAGDVVALLFNRNEYIAIGPFAVERSGAAYQPLDPSYPPERLNFMVNDARAKLLICDRELRDLLSEYDGDVLYTDEISELPKAPDFGTRAQPNNAMLLIYTSGTTGTPKGCVIENRNVTALYQTHKEKMEMGRQTRLAMHASPGFDAGVMDTMLPLMAGGALFIIPEEIRLDIGRLEEFFCENKITQGFMTTQLASMFLQQTQCKTLRTFTFGGEKLVPFNPPEWIKAINGYGPSETLAYVCSHTVTDDSPIQPVGLPNYNTKLYVVDAECRMLPIGCCGELCISGDQVSRGYFERPEKTAEVFVENPFENAVGYNRMYKTGDIVRMLSNGEIDFVGRRDGQVKIRGFRIELTEVEQIIREFDGIDNATVQAYDAPSGGKFIAAYITSEKEIDIDELNAFIGSEKPSYMVPEVTLQIDEIPYNVNGKVDKRKLPEPVRKIEDIILPQTEMQQKIFDIAAGVLGNGEFGITTDLFYAGLTSLSSIKLNTLLADAFGVSLSISDIKNNPTVKALEKILSSPQEEEKLEALDRYELTKTQEGIYAECAANPDTLTYNIPILLALDSSVDIEKLKRAIVEAVEAHPYIKTEISTDENGVIYQKRNDDIVFGTDEIKVTQVGSIDGVKDNLLKAFKLSEGRLFRFEIFDADRKYLFVDIHHIIADGTSLVILLRDISEAYDGRMPNAELFSGFDVSYIEKKKRQGELFDNAKKYYAELLGGLDCEFAPGCDILEESQKGSGKLIASSESENTKAVLKYCEDNSLSVNAFFCSAFGFLLAKYNATEYSIFNTVYNGRGDSRTQNTVSMLVKTLPVVVKIQNGDIADLISKTATQLTDSMSNDIYSYAEISREHGLNNDIMFIYQGDNFGFEKFCSKPCEEIELPPIGAKSKMTVQVKIENGRFVFDIDYMRDVYSEKFVEFFLSAFESTILSFICEKELDCVNMLSAKHRELIDKCNNSQKEFDRSLTTVSMFERFAQAAPDRIAVCYKDEVITYKRLSELTDKLCAYLNSKGIGEGDFVSVLIPRNEYMPITSIGIIKAGAAYEPLDPTYPPERLSFMIENCKAKLLIADREIASLVSDTDIEVLYTDEIPSLPNAKPQIKSKPENASLIIYTSGTTGTPKGCVIEDRNIVALCYHHANVMGIGEKSRIANYASFGFDAGVMDIFGTLCNGASLYVIPDDIRLDLSLIDKLYIDNKITHGFMTTQVGRMFAQSTTCESIEAFLVGGEKLVPFNPPKSFKFINGYGPSETLAYVCSFVVRDDRKLQPIGKVGINSKLYICDKNGRMLPPGACGELCISGYQVSRGYLGLPEKTAEVFKTNEIDNVDGYERIYRTGDTVRMLTDGNYEFVGRRDGQVKIRGFRVELTEVEKVIREFDGIKNACVAAFDLPAGGKYIAAYVVSDKKVDVTALNEFIGSQKPSYMIPTVTMQIDEIPLNANAKVDKRKLPKPENVSAKEGAAPENEIEEAFCEIFREVLSLDKVYADDDFFDIGGSSILAVQVVVKSEKRGYPIVYKNLFDNSTPQKLAEFIKAGDDSVGVFAPSGEEKEKYDYSALEYNVTKNLPNIKKGRLGNILLAGATGFLGAHVLREILDSYDSNVICLVRPKDKLDAKTRLEVMMGYYFEDWYNEEKKKRVTVLSGDLETDEVFEKLLDMKFDTIVNCAANVKHFADMQTLLQDNFSGVEHLITLAKKTGAMLVQTSSLSVGGESVNGNIPHDFIFRENNLNVGQALDNKYCYTKYLAEQAIIDAVSRGEIRAKIIRLGNLMARAKDGEFQINADTNGFLKQFVGYYKLGCFPVDMMDADIEFSPIDATAKATLLLATTPDEFTVFHAKNCNEIQYGYFVNALNEKGFNIELVESDEFERRFKYALEHDENLGDYSSLIAYLNKTDDSPTEIMKYSDSEGAKYESRVKLKSDTVFTAKALYRLGFAWPLISSEYLKRMIDALAAGFMFDV